jgi:hypothetical protein
MGLRYNCDEEASNAYNIGDISRETPTWKTKKEMGG